MVNPLVFCYGSLIGVDRYFGPSAILVTGRANRNDPLFQAARAAGAEVYAYVNVTSIPERFAGPLDEAIYTAPFERRWPYPIPGQRIGYVNSFTTYRIADMRAGSPWSDFAIERIVALRDSGQFDGVFLDSFGHRLWNPNAAWDTWPASEQREWSDGVISFAKRLREAVGETFVLVANSTWEASYQAAIRDALDGPCLEHHPVTRASAVNAIARPYRPDKPRGLWISLPGEVEAAALLPGVTHISIQQSYTADLPPPPVPFNDLRLIEARRRITLLEERSADLVIERDELEDEVTSMATRITELAVEIANAQDRIATLTSERDAAEAEVTTVTAERDRCQRLITDANVALTALLNS